MGLIISINDPTMQVISELEVTSSIRALKSYFTKKMLYIPTSLSYTQSIQLLKQSFKTFYIIKKNHDKTSEIKLTFRWIECNI